MVDTRDVLKRLDVLIAKADALVASGKGVDHYWVDRELRADFRVVGLSVVRDMFGEDNIHYRDFERCAGGITVSDAQEAKGILRAIRDEVREGRWQRMPGSSQEHTTDRRCVFVVHGRNEGARKAMFGFLRALGLEPLEWSNAIALTGSPSPYVGQVLDVAFREAQAVVVLLTGDDLARLGTAFVAPQDPVYERELTPQARPNVLFEAGMALGRQPERTILVSLGETRPFSDVAGRHTLRLTNDPRSRQEFVSRLKTAGCALEDVAHRTDWLSEGDFDGSVLQSDDGGRTTTPSAQNPSPKEERAAPSDEKKYALLSLLHQLRLVATSLPQERSTGEQIRNVTLWPESDPAMLRNLAASFGMTPANLGAEAYRHLATIAERAKSVQHTPRAKGFDWSKFDWSRWSRALEGAERCLVSLATAIEPDWRSMV